MGFCVKYIIPHEYMPLIAPFTEQPNGRNNLSQNGGRVCSPLGIKREGPPLLKVSGLFKAKVSALR